jgi:uncharacterized protein (DUF58 family)
MNPFPLKKLRYLLKAPPFSALPYTVPSRYCFILPTGLGMVFAAVLVAVLIAAVNYHNNLAFALGFVLISMFFVSMVHTHAQVKNLVIDSIRSEPVFAGETAVCSLFIKNPGKDRFGLSLSSAEGGKTNLDLPGEAETRVEFLFRTAHRGMHALPELKLSSEYPFGLCRAWHRFRPDHHSLVYAAKYSPRSEVLACYARAEAGGIAASGDEFTGIREYIPGDRMQIIAWKASAKGLGLRSKEFSGDSGAHVRFLWEDLPEMNGEERLSMLTSLVWEAEARDARYELVLPGKSLGPGSGRDFLLNCLRTLALYDLTGRL